MTYILSAIAALSVIGIAIACYFIVSSKAEIERMFSEGEDK